jgi:hypothetical protein
MADMNFERFEGSRRTSNRAAEPRNLQPLVNLAGAVTSVALVLGLAIWGYKLAVRDVSGIPVVRALEGPMRVAPAVPGGSVADNQGLAVNAIAAEGNAAAPADRLVLAPPSVELSLDDEAGLSSTAPIAAADQVDALMNDQTAADPAALEDTSATGTNESAIDQALAAALSEGEDVSPDATVPDTVTGALDAAGVVVRSPRPLARPGSAASATEAALSGISTVEDVVSVASPEMQPSDVALGTRLVQLGAFDTADGARAEWTRLQGNFGDLMAGKAIIVQPATSGGQTFFRLRAFGFSDEDDSRRFCSALLSEDTACIPVTQR